MYDQMNVVTAARKARVPMSVAPETPKIACIPASRRENRGGNVVMEGPPNQW